MKIGMNLLLWTDHVSAAQDAILDTIKELGYDAVEIPIFNTSDLKDYARLGKRLQSLGLSATAVTVMGPDINPISPDAKIRAAAVAYLDRVLECGQQFGCEILCGPLHSTIGVFSGTGPTETEFQHGVETLQEAAQKAEARGIKLAIEYLNRFENYFLTTAAQTSRFIKAVNHPSCKMMYDSFHAHIEEKDQAKAIASCAADTIHVHISENDRGTPGTGQVHWDSFFGGLKQSGYDGYMTIEAFGTALPALAAATRVWRDLFPDASGLCREGLGFIKKSIR
ncbi:sugar phosphate isomerase/epimerase family protein [Paludisphaera borealis]|uniref:D-tagatose 3-epimerase n=1 Tax=Paludisphaera borealis TaxID=1387353 RepID=A0A1U7CNY0_9BACT|nr:sugar phosphate isomerase/epimerase [Paludisphaera borealis]APW60618.1 D-tagatose 3-epimerase [Paludisphaera borealis]